MAARPATLSDLALAIDLGGTQLRAALVDRGGHILARAEARTLANAGAGAVLAQIVSLAGQMKAAARDRPLASAGVSSPGPLDTVTGVALGIPTIKGFSGFPFRDALVEALKLPVALENDGIAAAIGEWRFGAGQGRQNLVYVTVSTGIGGGVIADGRVLRGKRGMAGHIGHMSFVAGGDLCNCGNRGCFEAYASGPAFAARAAKAAASDAETKLGRDGEAVTAPAVFAAARGGDALAQRLVEEQAALLGRGFASLLHLYSPDLLIMGGGLSRQFAMLEQGILHSLRSCAMPAFRETPVVAAALGQDSGLLGAASLAFDLSEA